MKIPDIILKPFLKRVTAQLPKAIQQAVPVMMETIQDFLNEQKEKYNIQQGNELAFLIMSNVPDVIAIVEVAPDASIVNVHERIFLLKMLNESISKLQNLSEADIKHFSDQARTFVEDFNSDKIKLLPDGKK